MNYKKIIEKIRKGTFAPVYFLYGEEEFYKMEIADALERHVLSEAEKAFNKIMVSALESGVSAILDYARRYPVMAERQYVLCKDAENISDFDPLIPYFEKPAATTVLLLMSTQKSFDRRTKAYKALKKNAVIFESRRPYEERMPGWIKDYVELKGRKIDHRSAQLVAQYLGMDLKKTANELDKLCLLIDEEGAITIDDIEKSIGISREFNVFELLKAMGEGKVQKTLFITEQMAANIRANPLTLVTGAFYNYFSRLYKIKFLDKNERGDVAALLGVNPYFVKEYLNAERRFSVEEIESVFEIIHETDLKSKGIGVHHLAPEDIFKELILRIIALKPEFAS